MDRPESPIHGQMCLFLIPNLRAMTKESGYKGEIIWNNSL